MPNIELHGYTQIAARTLRRRIYGATAGLPFADGVLVSIVNSECIGRKNEKSPFIRICDPDPKLFDPIINALDEALNIIVPDIETLKLHSFRKKKNKMG
jgi:hypothetical protein